MAGKSGPSFGKYLLTQNSQLLKVYPSETYLKQCYKNAEIMPVACVTTNLQYLDRGKSTKPIVDFLRNTQDELCLTAEPYSLSTQNRGSVANQRPNLEACRGERRVDDIRTNPGKLQP
ncbi:MAG: hypothetical protein NTV34_20685 [Proteobacteria bacterium]|nr:hypothetical protein [Pseudomonadota bacterium]